MRLIIMCLLLSYHLAGHSAKISDEAIAKMRTLFVCGQGTERGFNGWMIDGLDENLNTYFDFNQLEFYTHTGGNYTISLNKKLDQMVGFSDLLIQTTIAQSNDCNIEHMTAQISADGREWVYLQENLLNENAQFYSDKMNFQFLRLSTSIRFSRNGRFRLGGVQIFGGTNYRKLKSKSADETQETEISKGKAIEDFKIFSLDKKLHIETQSNDCYRIVICNSKGKPIKKSNALGSNNLSVEDMRDGIYFVVIEQNNKAIVTKKVAF